MVQFKNILVMLIVAVLFSTFTFSLGNAFIERPNYDNFCEHRYPEKVLIRECEDVQQLPNEYEICNEQGGYLRAEFGEDGCVSDYTCDMCEKDLDKARESFNLIIFLFMSILGVVAIIITLLIKRGEEILTWILNGFLLGGLISIFFGTVIYFGEAPRWLRPIIILIELLIVIVVYLKKYFRKERKKK